MDVSKGVGVEGVGRSPVYGGVALDEDRLVRLGLASVVLVLVLGNNRVGIWIVGLHKALMVNSCKQAWE